MIDIIDKKKCCGCASCVQRCPKQCISLKEDAEGFLYPIVDKSVCIDCGLCEKVCPLLNVSEALMPIKVLAVKNRNEEERMYSSSGGVFFPLAKVIISKGGVVFGAVYDDNWEVVITHSESMEGVRLMMGSKYLQARVETAYQDAESFLKQGREVLFTGSPCQIAGLKRFLRKDYPNLLAVDFLCHGVPSPGVWRRYLRELTASFARRATAGKNTVLSLSLNTVPAIAGIEFRDKKMNGWKKYSFVVRKKSVLKTDKNSVLLSDIHSENPFMRGFLSDIYLRPSCYECKCKNGVSHSDITIADFWGIDRLIPDFDDDKGVGLVLISSTKGLHYFNALPMEVRETTLADAKENNGGFKEYIVVHSRRSDFFRRLNRGASVTKAVELSLKEPLFRKVIRLGKRVMRKVLKGLLRT